MPTLDLILDRLSAEKDEVRKEQLDELRKYKAAPQELPLLYGALTRDFKNIDNEIKIKSILLHFLWKVKNETTLPFMRDHFHDLPRDPLINFSAIRVLTEIRSRESLEFMLELLREENMNLGFTNFYYLWEPLRQESTWGSIIFPALIEIQGTWEYVLSTLHLAIQYRKLRSIRGKALDKLKEPLLRLYEELSIIFDESANPIAVHINLEILAAIVELLGDFAGQKRKIRRIIKKSMSSSYPALAAAGVRAAIIAGIKLSSRDLKRAALDPLYLPELYEFLEFNRMENEFPKKYHTQAHFAMGDVVRWLKPYGRPMKVIYKERKVFMVDGVARNFYLCSFVYAEEEYLALSGPQPLEEEKVYPRGKMTCSLFQPLDPARIGNQFQELVTHAEKDFS